MWYTAAIRDSVVWVEEEQILVGPLAALNPVVACHWTEEGIWEGGIPPYALHLPQQAHSFLPVRPLYLIPCNVLVIDSLLITSPYIPAMTLPHEPQLPSSALVMADTQRSRRQGQGYYLNSWAKETMESQGFCHSSQPLRSPGCNPCFWSLAHPKYQESVPSSISRLSQHVSPHLAGKESTRTQYLGQWYHGQAGVGL